MVSPTVPAVPVASPDRERTGQLRFALVLTSAVFVGEAVGGLWTGSLALLSDAGHVLSDILSLGLSLFALRLACRPPTVRHSYGLHRAEVLAALVNGLSLLVICGLIFHEAYQRALSPPPVRSVPMLAVAVVGLVANWLVARRLSGHAGHDINLRGAYLHVLGDLLASVGVVVAAAVMALTGWRLADPLVSAGIGALIAVGALRLCAEALHILLEGVPRGVELQDVVAAMLQVPGVEGVHHVHAWSICSNVLALSAHVVTCPEDEQQRARTRRELDYILRHRFGFAETTLELECDPCHNSEVLQPVPHVMGVAHSHDHRHDGEHE